MSNALDITPNHTQEMVDLSQEVLNNIADYVKMELGAPLVDVEIPDHVLLKIIDRSIKSISKYNLIVLWHTVIPNNKKIDLSSFPNRVSYVIDVLKSKGDSLSNTTAMTSMFGFPAGLRTVRTSNSYPYGTITDITSIFNESVLMQKNMMAYKDNLSFDIDRTNNILYLDTGLVGEYNVTVEYVPLLELNDLYLLKSNQDAMDVISKLSAGYTMILLGRARGKYQTSNYSWSISSDELLSEGKRLVSETEAYLNHNYSYDVID